MLTTQHVIVMCCLKLFIKSVLWCHGEWGGGGYQLQVGVKVHSSLCAERQPPQCQCSLWHSAQQYHSLQHPEQQRIMSPSRGFPQHHVHGPGGAMVVGAKTQITYGVSQRVRICSLLCAFVVVDIVPNQEGQEHFKTRKVQHILKPGRLRTF